MLNVLIVNKLSISIINMNIILIGYMASGKSLIGENLSHMLNMQFIDFDNYIEKKEDASIHDIFERKGELCNVGNSVYGICSSIQVHAHAQGG